MEFWANYTTPSCCQLQSLIPVCHFIYLLLYDQVIIEQSRKGFLPTPLYFHLYGSET